MQKGPYIISWCRSWNIDGRFCGPTSKQDGEAQMQLRLVVAMHIEHSALQLGEPPDCFYQESSHSQPTKLVPILEYNVVETKMCLVQNSNCAEKQ
jgi:hypothetical protein